MRLSEPRPERIAVFFLPSPLGGGVARVMLNLVGAFARQGYAVDLIVPGGADSAHRLPVPDSVRVVALEAAPAWRGPMYALSAEYDGPRALLFPHLLAGVFRYLPDLVRYLRQERPTVLLSAKTYSNLAALWARQLAGVPTRVVVTEHTSLSHEIRRCVREGKWPWRLVPRVLRDAYPRADAVVAVSVGVADDLATTTGLPRERIATIYNPVVTPELRQQALGPLDHPWFARDSPPVVLGAGRLIAQKDFPTLLRAFARVRAVRPARLVILGEGDQRRRLEGLARELGIAADVALPGAVQNPFPYMANAAVFVLSSAWEGFSNVTGEALACGCPVVSTNCPSGPSEILDGGAYGPLVPVGDDAALAKAILSVLDDPPDRERLRAQAAKFSVERATDSYLEVLLGAR